MLAKSRAYAGQKYQMKLSHIAHMSIQIWPESIKRKRRKGGDRIDENMLARCAILPI